MVMVNCHYVERIGELSLPLIFRLTYTIIKKYYPCELVNITIQLVPDNTVNLSHNHPLFGTQGSLSFDFVIDLYTLPSLFLIFYLLIYRSIYGLVHARGCFSPIHWPLLV